MIPFLIEPQITELLCDTLTPVSAYLALRDHYANSLLFEHGTNGNDERAFSYICCEPVASISLHHGSISMQLPGDAPLSSLPLPEPVTALETFMQFFEVAADVPDLPFAYAGIFGYLAYDAARYAEPYTDKPPAQDIPQLYYALYRLVLAFDHTHNRLYIIHNQVAGIPEKSELITMLVHLLRHAEPVSYSFRSLGTETSSLTDEAFTELVETGRQYCQQGEVFQIVLSRRFKQAFSGDDFNVYRALRSVNPSPYMFYLDYGSFRLMGASPEAQLVIRSDKAQLFPIAGTMPRTGHATTDKNTAARLSADPKENAEHVMLVDLARNDLHRHCSNVTVAQFKTIRHFSHVMHLVSEVTGTPQPGTSAARMLLSTFPAGTLSGAPRIRAMQLIEKHEPENRNFYGGCTGFLGFDGQCNHAIMIRSLLSQYQTLHYQAGAGVVIHSAPPTELAEVQHKLNAVRKAITLAQTL
jgi:anthranilate synthase component 1